MRYSNSYKQGFTAAIVAQRIELWTLGAWP